MKRSSAMMLLAGLVFHPALSATDNTLVVHDAWVREAPPNTQVLAGYIHIENAADQADAIIAVSSTAFEKAEIHRSEVKDGMARMAQLKSFALPPHHVMKLGPGGTHIMLFNPKTPLHAGQHVTLIFTLNSGKTLNVDADVRNPLKADEHRH